ncbi:MAG: hypothetical protein PHS37_07115 [Candidatus Omnitrophica bacterium]|nr:hypothetical protein [Candidatus Omnitrophota bacterium]
MIQWFLNVILFIALVIPTGCFAETPAKVNIVFLEFYPTNDLKAGAAFEIVFNLKNTGGQPVNPYAEVTLYGDVYNEKGVSVLRILDKKYRIYNFWPGDEGGRQRLYIGALPKGKYSIRLNVSSFDRGKGVVLSEEKFELPVTIP